MLSLISILLFAPCAPETTSCSAPMPPPRTGGVYVVAHRGVHGNIPENTLAAYRKAIEIGADYVEVDLRATKDGHIVSVHNDTLEHYTKDADGPVKSYTLAELKAMDIGSRVGPEWREERIPTFDEILDLCKGKIGIYLDLKEAPVDVLVEKICARKMEHAVLWYAGAAAINQIKRLCPECIPMPDPGVENLLPYVLKQWTPRVVATTWGDYSREFVAKCHDAGACVIADDKGPDCWAEALDWGTDGIQTDQPEKLIAFLKEREDRAGAQAPKDPGR